MPLKAKESETLTKTFRGVLNEDKKEDYFTYELTKVRGYMIDAIKHFRMQTTLECTPQMIKREVVFVRSGIERLKKTWEIFSI